MSSKLERLKEIRKNINLEINGIKNCEHRGVNLFIPNHNCLKDIFYLPMSLEHDIASLISSRLIYKNIEERKQLVEECLYSLPIEAHGGSDYSNMCLNAGVELLKSGIDISIFPEGAYIEDDVIHKGRTGASRILFSALEENVEVNLIPVAIGINKEKIDLDSYSFLDDSVTIDFLDPIDYTEDFSNYVSTNDYETKNQCLHNVMDLSFKNIANKLNKEYDDSYIELYPKGNVIYSNGVVLPTDIAQNKYYLDLYKNQLKKDSSDIVKQLKKK